MANKKVRVGCWSVFAAFLGLFAASAWIGGDDNSTAHRRTDAEATCRRFVEARLRAPATAVFTDPVVTAVDAGGDAWQVSGAVDSHNLLGVPVRNTYVCVVSTTDGRAWDLESLTGLTS